MRIPGITRQKKPVAVRVLAFLTLCSVLVPALLTYLSYGDSIKSVLSSVNEAMPLSLFSSSSSFLSSSSDQDNRSLSAECGDGPGTHPAQPTWLVVFYLIGVLYMFLAIALVCDELFVPALEVMAGRSHLHLSMDVAGATLMAAGGSAPELFTNVFGTFVQKDNSIGIGTIVGSAVFNVLFVIACCAVFTQGQLELTWWPLFRDATCYSVGLVVLGIFVGVITPGKITIWEASVLFLLYIGYVVLMKYNRSIYYKLTGKHLKYPDEEDEDTVEQEPDQLTVTDMPEQAPSRTNAVHKDVELADEPWPGTFHAGIANLLSPPRSSPQQALSVGAVALVQGNAIQVFIEVDTDGSGDVDRHELEQLLRKLQYEQVQDEDEEIDNEAQLDALMQQLDFNGDGKICQQDFVQWYAQSEHAVSLQARYVFDQLDTNRSGTIDARKIQRVLMPHVSEQDAERAVQTMYQEGSRDQITFDEFEAWYQQAILQNQPTDMTSISLQGPLDEPDSKDQEETEDDNKDDDDDGFLWDHVHLPQIDANASILSRILSWTQYVVVLPIAFVLGITVPDVRRPGYHRLTCYFSFLASILWIGCFSYFMVDWTEMIGRTAGIPSIVMGLTLLAAGTSVPDLLSSVIVARQGEGDMALSSSIGSNIFDILVGLPLPWLLYAAIYGESIDIGSSRVWLYIFTLLGMLVFVVTVIHFQGWKMTNTLAVFMLIFYFGFLAMAIVLALQEDGKC